MSKNVDFTGVIENKVRTFTGLNDGERVGKDAIYTWVKKRTNVGCPENRRKSRLWAKKKAEMGKEKGRYWVLDLSVKKKK